MEPEIASGEPFTPSFHPDALQLESGIAELESDTELESFETAKVGDFEYFRRFDHAVPLVAIDAGVIDLGVTRTGFALAFKAAVVAQDVDGTHFVAKVGPRTKFITQENRAELLRFIGSGLLKEDMFVNLDAGGLSVKKGATEPNQFKDRIRNYLERMLQLDVVQQLAGGILLVDGALTLRTYNTPEVFMDRLGKEAAKKNSELVGVSKKSRLTVDGVSISALLDGDPPDSGFRMINAVDSVGPDSDAASRNLGTPFAVRFAPAGFTFRVDVTRQSLLPDEQAVLAALFANTQMTLGYPNLLRLSHIHSAFTKDEIVSLQVAAAHDYKMSMRAPEDLSVIFAPFRKGLGG
jgi:hypothetical protein